MKLLLFVGLLSLVGLSLASTDIHPRGCIYIMGRCHSECEVGTHAYALGCGHRVPEATCEKPDPQEEPFMMCDYSACYCDPPTLRDTSSKKCVMPEQCPKKV